MLIEQVFPQVVGAKSSLQDRLAVEGRSAAIPPQLVDEIVSTLPLKILNSDCFFDQLTKVWRYEFGFPRRIAGNRLLWGTHMWTPVTVLLRVLRAAHHRLDDIQRRRYLARLADLEKHEDVLSEFLPVVRLPDQVSAEFEHPTGAGGRDVEWRIQAGGKRPVLIEVKNRMRDLLEVAGRMEAGERDPDGSAPAPTHDVAILFRGIEHKFGAVDPDDQLQGAWIATDLQQEEAELATAFTGLDSSKDPGIVLLTRREADRAMILDLFRERQRDRFTFRRRSDG